MNNVSWKYKVTSQTSLIGRIASLVRSQGTLTNQAKSQWGADVYEHQGVCAKLCDEGSTWVINAEGLNVAQTMDFEPQFQKGNYEILGEVYRELFKDITDVTASSATIFEGTGIGTNLIKIERPQAVALFEAYLSLQGSPFNKLTVSVPRAEALDTSTTYQVVLQSGQDTPTLHIESTSKRPRC